MLFHICRRLLWVSFLLPIALQAQSLRYYSQVSLNSIIQRGGQTLTVSGDTLRADGTTFGFIHSTQYPGLTIRRGPISFQGSRLFPGAAVDVGTIFPAVQFNAVGEPLNAGAVFLSDDGFSGSALGTGDDYYLLESTNLGDGFALIVGHAGTGLSSNFMWSNIPPRIQLNTGLSSALFSELPQAGLQEGRDAVVTADFGALVMVYDQAQPNHAGVLHLIRLDSMIDNFGRVRLIFGDSIQSYAQPNQDLQGQKMHRLANRDLLIVGHQRDTISGAISAFAMRLDSTGTQQLWYQTYPVAGGESYAIGALELPSGDLLLWGQETATSSLRLLQTDNQGNPTDTITYLSGLGYLARDIDSYPTGYALLAFDSVNYASVLLLTDSLGQVPTTTVRGTFFQDQDLDCVFDAGEDSVLGYPFVVELIGLSTQDTLYASVGPDGTYEVPVLTGDYVLQHHAQHPYHSYPCQSIGPISLTTAGQTDTVDFPVEFTAICPLNFVDIGSPFLRLGDTNRVEVQVCNLGTALSYPTQVGVVLDSFFTVISADLPIAAQQGDTILFDLDSLATGTCVNFGLNAFLDSTAYAGQTHCLEAFVTPDSVCSPNFWDGPILRAQGSCDGDSVKFEVQNFGADMSLVGSATIYIDDVIFRTDSLQLDSNEIRSISLLADTGATYRVAVAQAAGFPSLLGDQFAYAFVEGCQPFADGSFHLGWITSYYNGNASPFAAISCLQNVTSYDPNDKQGEPLGYGPQRYIEANDPIDYRIRFQNTGTDTAFRVILLDTLPAQLDPSTLQMGASSHPYTWNLSGQGVLQITFNPIALPDSMTDALGSVGFVRFRIQQRPGNAPGTVIRNRAGIFFDFNPVVLTNYTSHQIEEDFVPVLTWIEDATSTPVSVNVYPNPFQHRATVQVDGQVFRRLTLRLYDLQGQEVYQHTEQGNHRFHIEPESLVPGLYLYRLEGDGQLVSTGKVMAQ